MKWLPLIVILVGCGGSPEMGDANVFPDAGMEDADVDSALEDSGMLPDADIFDSAMAADSSVIDSGVDSSTDSGVAEDSSVADSGSPDSGMMDSGTDSGSPPVDSGPLPPPVRAAVVEIAGNGNNFCGRDTSDGVWCWGSFFSSGFQYMGQATSVRGLCGLRPDGVVVCYNLGAEEVVMSATGPLVADILAEDGTSYAGCAIASGDVWCWAWPPPVLAEQVGVSGATTASRGCAINSTGVWCWDSGTLLRVHGTTFGKVHGAGANVVLEFSGTVISNSRNTNCNFNDGGERPAWDTGFISGAHQGVFDFGGNSCSIRPNGWIWCIGLGAGGGRPTNCDWHLPYGATDSGAVQLVVSGGGNCVLLDTGIIECWTTGSPSDIGW